MNRFFKIASFLAIGSASAFAQSADFAPATYILQVSSNLSCETLNIQLVSESGESRQNLTYSKNAFASTSLAPGSYVFGDVTCSNGDNQETLDVLKGKIAPLHVATGQAYYGGRIIFQEVATDERTPKTLSDCPYVNSRQRGEKSNNCQDGIGVDASVTKQVNVYAPDVTDEHIAEVRNALSVSKEQLLYLPLKV